MKVEVGIIALLLAVSCTADQYSLKCTPNEMEVLWPIYENKTMYFRCLNVGQPVVMTCNAGTLFTFVYQSCRLPSEYIPPPQLSYLPTDPPAATPGTNTPTPSTLSPTPTQTSDPTTKSTKITKPTPFTLPSPETPSSTSSTASTITTRSTVSTESTEKTIKTTAPPVTPPTQVTKTLAPGPPSPPNTAVPLPSTPKPTPPNIDDNPQQVPATAPSG